MSNYSVPEGTRIYAIGDIHGEAALLDLLLADIREDAEKHPAERHLLIYLGDYVDRGPDTRGVIERLLAGPPEGFEQICLLGNHEEMLLSCLKGIPRMKALWLLHGGDAACRSYGIDPSQPPEAVAEKLRRRMPLAHKELLHRLQLWHREGDYFFTHAGIRPGVALDEQRREDLIWIRKAFTDCPDDHGCVVVHGHSVVPAPEDLPNRINVDTGAAYGNALTAVVLQGSGRKFLQVQAGGDLVTELFDQPLPEEAPEAAQHSAEPARRAARRGWWR